MMMFLLNPQVLNQPITTDMAILLEKKNLPLTKTRNRNAKSSRRIPKRIF